jgi:hypothetical protein
MTAQSIVCGSCAADVPYGRLSCPSCGELLASVAGSRRFSAAAARSRLPEARTTVPDARSTVPDARPTVPDVLYDAGAAPSAAVVDGQLSLESAHREVDAELPWAASSGHGVANVAVNGIPADDPDDDDADFLDGAEDASVTAGPAWAAGRAGLSGSRTPSYMPRGTAAAATAPAAVAGASPAGVAASPSFAGPGAYVPPMPLTVVPAGPPAPAREWAGHGPEAGRASDAVGTAQAGSAASPMPAADRQARFAEFVGWLSVAGAAFAAVGFLLPWGLVVIGSAGIGYFDRWGLSGPGHVIIALGMLAVLGLALIKNIIPVWIRTGLIGLGLGAYLLGLVWPYIFALPGTGPGALIAAIGAVALTVAGLLALITDRHAGTDRPV